MVAAVAVGAVATAGPALIPRGGDGASSQGTNPLSFGQNTLEFSGLGGPRVAPEVLPLGDGNGSADDAQDAEDTADLAKGQRIADEQREAVERAEQERAAEEREKAEQEAAANGGGGGALAPAGSVVAPAEGRLTSGFGARWGTNHNGVDIANDIGTAILATTDGVVVESGPASGFGMWVRLQHTDGTISVYGHINRSLVEEGQQVGAGEQIAEMGNRGQSTGPHLHFEIWEGGGRKVNPLSWLQEHGVDL